MKNTGKFSVDLSSLHHFFAFYQSAISKKSCHQSRGSPEDHQKTCKESGNSFWKTPVMYFDQNLPRKSLNQEAYCRFKISVIEWVISSPYDGSLTREACIGIIRVSLRSGMKKIQEPEHWDEIIRKQRQGRSARILEFNNFIFGNSW